jgi:uncharacterized protein YraI
MTAQRITQAFSQRPIHTIFTIIILMMSITAQVGAQSNVTVELTATLRLRSGPGTEHTTIATMEYPARLSALAVNPSQTWVKVNYNGIVGWAANQYLRVVSGSLTSLPVEGGAVPPSSPSPFISFVADNTAIRSGQCVTLSWNVSGIREVYYQGQGVTGSGSEAECPTRTTTYTLRILQVDGSWVERWITVIVSAPVPPTPQRNGINHALPPTFGWDSLVAGFLPEPYRVDIISGGDVDVSYLGGECVGYAAQAPDFTFDYQGYGGMLRVYFVADDPSTDTTLIINKPNGSWSCSDDSFGTLNPSIRWNDALSGEYDVWVGTYSSTANYSGTLYITEIDSNHP